MHWINNVCFSDYQQDSNNVPVRLLCNPFSICLKSNLVYKLETNHFGHTNILFKLTHEKDRVTKVLFARIYIDFVDRILAHRILSK